MNSPAKLLAALVVACVFAILPSNLFAQSMHGEPELDAAVPYSEPYEGQALWFGKWFENLGPYYSSAVRVNDCWAIAAGHSVFTQGYTAHTLEVGNGPNALTDPGTVGEIAEFIMHPTWEAGGGVWNGHRLDLALLRFTQPLAGQDLEIGSLSLGEHFEYAGYGRPATPQLGLLPYDGERRGFEAKAHYWGGAGGNVSSKYVRTNFWPGELPLGGIGTGGGSGSGGFNNQGKLVALVVAQSGSPNYAGATYGLRLDLPQVKDWIESYTSDLSCIPSRPTPVPFGKASVFAVERDLLLCQDGAIC